MDGDPADALFIGVGIEHPKFFDGFTKKVMGLDEVLEWLGRHRATVEPVLE